VATQKVVSDLLQGVEKAPEPPAAPTEASPTKAQIVTVSVDPPGVIVSVIVSVAMCVPPLVVEESVMMLEGRGLGLSGVVADGPFTIVNPGGGLELEVAITLGG